MSTDEKIEMLAAIFVAIVTVVVALDEAAK